MSTHSPKQDHLRLLSTEQLARFLGVPVKTVYRWRERGAGPRAYRIGRHLRFRWADVRRWQERLERDA